MQNRPELLTTAYYVPYLKDGIRVVFILAAAYVVTAIAERLIRGVRKYAIRMMVKAGNTSEFEVEKRANTVSSVARKTLIVVIWVLACTMVLERLGFEIGPILASLGVVGVALGFGAQNLVKDILAGLFLLLENQIRVNDGAVINGVGGTVEEINLRTTVLRAENGAVHIFPNGNIQSLSNSTRDYSFFVFEIGVGLGSDPDQVIAALKEFAEELSNEEAYKPVVLAPLEIIGVDRLTDSAAIVKARIKTLPGKQWGLGREMNRRMRQRFVDANIEFPFPTRRIQLQEQLSPELRAEFKKIVREVLAEEKGAQ